MQGANGSYNVAHVMKAALFDDEDLQSVHAKPSAASGLPSSAGGGIHSAAGGAPSSAGEEESSKLIGTAAAAGDEDAVDAAVDGDAELTPGNESSEEDKEEEGSVGDSSSASSDGAARPNPRKPSHLGGFPAASLAAVPGAQDDDCIGSRGSY